MFESRLEYRYDYDHRDDHHGKEANDIYFAKSLGQESSVSACHCFTISAAIYDGTTHLFADRHGNLGQEAEKVKGATGWQQCSCGLC